MGSVLIDQEGKGRVPGLLAHHLSLPSKSSADIEKFLQLQDSVPCKIRAKRGCATHPRSIAERVSLINLFLCYSEFLHLCFVKRVSSAFNVNR